MGELDLARRPRKHPSLPFGGLKKFLCIAALSIVATLTFQSVATAQSVAEYSHDECSGAAEQRGIPSVEYLNFIQDVGGCVAFEGTGPNATVGAHNAPVYDPDTGEELGILKDLDPDLSSGDFSTTYEEFCEAFRTSAPVGPPAQEYYDQQANSQEQAILDPNSDGLACTDEDEAFFSGERQQPTPEDTGQPIGQENPNITDKCPFAADEEIISALGFSPDVGCVVPEGAAVAIPVVGTLNMPVVDPGTGEQIGILKDLDPDLTSGDFSITYQEFCDAFPTPEYPGVSFAGLTAQEYHDQLANDREKAILDPDSDGLACTADDEEFLSGDGPDYDYEPQTGFPQTWAGLLTQTMEDGTTLDFELEADLIPISGMTDDFIGEVVGQTRQEGIECEGVWILEEVNVDYIVVEERITAGAEYCVETTTITLTPQDDGSLEYYFLDMNDSVGEGILTLRGGGEDENPEYGDGDEPLPSERMGELGMTLLPDTGGLSLFAPLVGGLFLSIGILGVAAISRRTR